VACWRERFSCSRRDKLARAGDLRIPLLLCDQGQGPRLDSARRRRPEPTTRIACRRGLGDGLPSRSSRSRFAAPFCLVSSCHSACRLRTLPSSPPGTAASEGTRGCDRGLRPRVPPSPWLCSQPPRRSRATVHFGGAEPDLLFGDPQGVGASVYGEQHESKDREHHAIIVPGAGVMSRRSRSRCSPVAPSSIIETRAKVGKVHSLARRGVSNAILLCVGDTHADDAFLAVALLLGRCHGVGTYPRPKTRNAQKVFAP